MSASDYIRGRIGSGALTFRDVAEITKVAQRHLGLTVDGYPGPKTIAALRTAELVPSPDLGFSGSLTDWEGVDEPLEIDDKGWLRGAGVRWIPADASWYGPERGEPTGIVAHYSATNLGTADTMAERRTDLRKRGDRAASWHVSVEDGELVQMVPFTFMAWHCRTTKDGRRLVGRSVNGLTVGVELIGWGKFFRPGQVVAATRLWRALVRRYGIERTRAMFAHADLDPTRRTDPGEHWMSNLAPLVLDYAYR